MTPEAAARNLFVHCCCIDRLIYLFSSYFYFKTYFNNIHNLSCSVLFEGGGVRCFIYWPRSGRLSRGRCLLECGLLFEEIRYMLRARKVALFSRKEVKSVELTKSK